MTNITRKILLPFLEDICRRTSLIDLDGEFAYRYDLFQLDPSLEGYFAFVPVKYFGQPESCTTLVLEDFKNYVQIVESSTIKGLVLPTRYAAMLQMSYENYRPEKVMVSG